MSHLNEEILRKNAQRAREQISNYQRLVGKENENLYKQIRDPRSPITALYSSFREQKSQEKENIGEFAQPKDPKTGFPIISSIDTTEGSGPGSNVSGAIDGSTAAKITKDAKNLI